MKQYQKEVNEICTERIAKNANPLALVAAAQPYQDPYYQTPKSHKSYAPTSKAPLPTRSHAPTRNKGKEIAKPITHPSESASEEDSDPKQAQKDKEMQKNLTLIAKMWILLQDKNDNQTGQFKNQRTMTVVRARETRGNQECKKPKRVKDSTYHKEKMLMCKQAKKGVPLQVEQSDWLTDMDEEIDEQELEAHYNYMAKIKEHSEQPESTSNTSLVEHDDSNVIPDSPDMYDIDIQNNQNVVECDDERVALANLIANLIANLKLDCKSILAETSRTLGESNSVRDSCLVALQNKQTLNDRTVDYEKLEHKLNETLGLLAQKDIDIKEGLKLKAYEISVIKEKHNEKCKGKSVETKFDKPSVVQQPNAQRIPKPSVLGNPTPFSDSLERKSMYQIDTRTTQTRAPQLPQTFKNTNPRVSTSRGVIYKTNVSRPQLRSTQMKDKAVPNNSQVKDKKTEVEDHPRISSISNKTKTKKPKVVPISTRKPKSQANKLVATPHKKTVTSESTTQKSKSYYMMMYEKTSKAWKWWIEQQCTSGYKWVPKTKTKWMPKVRNENVQKRVSFAIDNASRITNVLKLTNTLGSNLSNIPSSSNSLADYSTHPIHLSKAKRSSFKTKDVPSSKGQLNLLHMDLCGPMRVASINGKKYILNGVVEIRNRTLVEAARMMLSTSKLPLFFWAEVIATACYTQNRSIIILTHEKMAYHIINERKPSIKHLHIFGCTCYLTKDGENLDKMKEKGDPFILVGYSTQSKGYRIYNKRTRLIVESIHLRFDEIKEMSETSVDNDTSGLVPQRQKVSYYDNSGLVSQLQNVSLSADTTVPSQQELDLLFGPLYDEFFTAGTSSVNKSSSPTKNSKQQDTPPTMNIQSSTEPPTPTNVNAKENNDNQEENAQFQ
ncbi:retrovirus-related pol polyprotein from transposon TNT 1-94 [Tanacetum coccineum]